MYPTTQDLKDLISQAESGEVKAARDGLREFTRRRPSVLLAWKWLADVAENPKERSEAIRRAQLLAPGDPWVIEAKKHRMPPDRAPKRSSEAMQTRPMDPAAVVAASAEHTPRPDDLTLVARMKRGEALELEMARAQPAAQTAAEDVESEQAAQDSSLNAGAEQPSDWSTPDSTVEPAAAAASPADETPPRVDEIEPDEVSPTDVTQAIGAIPALQAQVSAPESTGDLELHGDEFVEDDESEGSGMPAAWLLWAVVGLAFFGLLLLVAAVVTANVL